LIYSGFQNQQSTGKHASWVEKQVCLTAVPRKTLNKGDSGEMESKREAKSPPRREICKLPLGRSAVHLRLLEILNTTKPTVSAQADESRPDRQGLWDEVSLSAARLPLFYQRMGSIWKRVQDDIRFGKLLCG
jgi:hypothetical protein